MKISEAGLNTFFLPNVGKFHSCDCLGGNDGREILILSVFYSVPSFWVVQVAGHSRWPLKHGIPSQDLVPTLRHPSHRLPAQKIYNLLQTRTIWIIHVKMRNDPIAMYLLKSFKHKHGRWRKAWTTRSASNYSNRNLFEEPPPPQEVHFTAQSYFLHPLPLYCWWR